MPTSPSFTRTLSSSVGPSRATPGGSSPAAAAPASASARARLLAWYLANLEARPVLTKALTSCGIFTVADAISQYLTFVLNGTPPPPPALLPEDSPVPPSSPPSPFHWDALRTARMGAVGLILSGPTLHVWYGLMASWRPGRDMGSILQKLGAGTVLYGPLFNAIFFSANGALQGEGSSEIAARLRRDLLPTIVNGLMYWPFCDILTYRFVPVHLQGARALVAQGGGQLRAPYESVGARNEAQLLSPGPEAEAARPPPAAVMGVQPSLGSPPLFPPALGHQQRHFSTAASACSGPYYSPRAPAPGVPSLRLPFSVPPSSSRGEGTSGQATAAVGCLVSSTVGRSGPAWAGGVPVRTFVQLQTLLDVADNSGAKTVMCIKVLKGAKPNAAKIGDIIIASVKTADFHGKVKKGDVVTCVVVRSAMARRRADGSMVRFDGPAAVVINKSGEPIGTRVFGPVPHELRLKKMLKILALAQYVA